MVLARDYGPDVLTMWLGGKVAILISLLPFRGSFRYVDAVA
jgi:hypothetical protein